MLVKASVHPPYLRTRILLQRVHLYSLNSISIQMKAGAYVCAGQGQRAPSLPPHPHPNKASVHPPYLRIRILIKPACTLLKSTS